MLYDLEDIVHGGVLQVEGLGDPLVGDLAVNHVEAGLDTVVVQGRLLPALVGDLDGIGKRGVGQSHGGGDGHGSGHVGNAVVDHAVHDVCGFRVGGGFRCLETSALVDGNIHDDSIWDQLGLDEAAESGIESETLPPMLIVMPEGGTISNQTSGGPYSYESVIVDELRPHIEANYCAWQDAAGRAIGGLSRGGYWSLEIAFRNPALFGSVGGHGAALVDTYAGPTLDPKYTASTSDLSSLRVYLDAGNSDWYLGQLQVLHNNLLAADKDHSWVIQEGGHNNDYWSAHVSDYLAWYAEPWFIQRDELPICGALPAG